MSEMVLAQLAALKTTSTPDLKTLWRKLNDSEPPPYNRRFLESRLAYRVQELAFGGLKPATVKKLEALGEQIDGKRSGKRKPRTDAKPIAGTRLVREWQGTMQTVTVTAAGFEWQGRPYQSLSAVARAITGTRWNGWIFFGLKKPAASGSMSARGTKARQEAPLAPPAARKLRCAVYTRKSSEEGLEQAFNSLDAQREACEAYILSQRAEGWLLVPDRYDDGGISGGTLERPALRRLLADIEAGRVHTVVVYKIDRLSRALMDFAKLVEVFDRHAVTFVSVTQAFNTTTSMGRLTLNVLLSFAQFEREVIGERIRDKFAASRRKGMWMGGTVPFGYVVRDRKLVIHEEQAATVRMIFERFNKIGSATTLAQALAREGVLTPRGKPIDKGFLYKLLTNRVYVGEAVHKGTAYPGEHQAIVTRSLWDKVHAVLQESPRKRAADTRTSAPALLKGLIFGPTGCAMSPTHTRKSGRLYRYYVSQAVLKQGRDACPVGRLPAAEIEAAVIDQVRGLLRAPEIVVGTWRASKPKVDGLSEEQVRRALQDLDPLWDELFPAEQARIVQLLVERVDVGTQGFDLRLRVEGLAHLARDLSGKATETRKAA